MRTGLYYFHSLKQRVFKCSWYIKLDGALDPLSDFRSWCSFERIGGGGFGVHYWGLDLSPVLRSGQQ